MLELEFIFESCINFETPYGIFCFTAEIYVCISFKHVSWPSQFIFFPFSLPPTREERLQGHTKRDIRARKGKEETKLLRKPERHFMTDFFIPSPSFLWRLENKKTNSESGEGYIAFFLLSWPTNAASTQHRGSSSPPRQL